MLFPSGVRHKQGDHGKIFCTLWEAVLNARGAEEQQPDSCMESVFESILLPHLLNLSHHV